MPWWNNAICYHLGVEGGRQGVTSILDEATLTTGTLVQRRVPEPN